ncbi:MAG: hypothetical protein HWN66_09125 [Candidatus Helarchaeota archaeon]|nr:hypothetical protein [Candidatus Helarchaeota archaeon]
MQSSRTILTTFFSLIADDQRLQAAIAPVKKRLQRLDLRKKNARITLWNILQQLKAIESPMSDAIDGLMVDLAGKWINTLGKALRENKISK